MNHKSRLAVFLVVALLLVPALTRAGDLSVIDTYLNERRVAAGLSPLNVWCQLGFIDTI